MKFGLLIIISTLLLCGCGSLTTKGSIDHADISTSPYRNLQQEQLGNKELWWHQFNDPQLNNLIEQLFRSNITLRVADARLKEARANLQISNSELLPWLNINGSAERKRTPNTLSDATGNNHTLQAIMGYEIDLWNKLGSQRDAAQSLLQFSDAEVDGLYLSLTAQFTTLYFSYQQQQQHYEIVERRLALRKKYLKFIRTRYQQGLEHSRQIYSAEQAADLAMNEVQILEIQLNSSEHAMALLLGIRRHELTIKAPTPVNTIRIEQNIGIPADLILRRPDVVSAWNKFYAADGQRAAAIAERLPTISLQASMGLLHNTLGSTTINDLFWSLAANALQPIIDGGKRRAVINKNEAIVEQRQYEALQTLLTAVYEVEDLLDKISGTEAMVAQLKHRHQQTTENERHVEHQYQRGLESALHLLEASDAAMSAERQLITIKHQQLEQNIQLTRAVGGDWMSRVRTKKEAL